MGGNGWIRQSNIDFSSFITELGLIEIPFKIEEYTWTNKRIGFLNIAERLDKNFVVGDWSSHPWTCIADILSLTGSDHYPIGVQIQDEKSPDRCPFKFEAMWLMDNNIRSLMEMWWKKSPESPGNKAFMFFKKLQFVKEQLKKWNRESFKNIFNEKLGLEEELKNYTNKLFNKAWMNLLS